MEPDGCYVLQTHTEIWCGQRRKRSIEEPLPEERQPKKPRRMKMDLDVLLLSLFEWMRFDEAYVFNNRGKDFYVAEARQPQVHSKTYNVHIKRNLGGSETMTLEDGAEANMFFCNTDRAYVVVLPTGEEFVSTKYRSYVEARAAQGAAYGL